MAKPLIGPIAKKLYEWLADHEVSVIAKHFDQYFLPIMTGKEEDKLVSYNIRHKVYCEELNFEPLRDDKQETDEFDVQSLPCLIQHKETSNYAGTVRIVCSSSQSELLPLEKFCSDSIKEGQIHPKNLPREKICEISRLAVPENFRRRNTDRHKGAATGVINEGTFSEQELRCFPFIAVGLYFSAASVVINNGIDHCFVMMEPRLARSMRLVGINFQQIGPVIEYHGKRAPYYIDPHKMIRDLKPGFRNLYDHINKALINQRNKQKVSDLSAILNPQLQN